MSNDALTTPHDQAIPPDSLYDLSINYQWRKLVAEMLFPMLQRNFWSGTSLDIDTAVDNAAKLILDLYDDSLTGGSMVQSSARALSNATVALTGGVPSTVYWTLTKSGGWDFDPDGWVTSDPFTAYTVPVGFAGLYLCTAQVNFANSNANVHYRTVEIRKNGSFAVALKESRCNHSSIEVASGIVNLADGDTVTVVISTSQLTMSAANGADDENMFSLVRLGD